SHLLFFFFFQAEDGIRDFHVTGVQTCALPIFAKNPPATNPLGEEFDYAKAFEQVDLDELKADIIEVLTTPQDWWPADFGHYGPRSEERRVGKECRCRWRPKH